MKGLIVFFLTLCLVSCTKTEVIEVIDGDFVEVEYLGEFNDFDKFRLFFNDQVQDSVVIMAQGDLWNDWRTIWRYKVVQCPTITLGITKSEYWYFRVKAIINGKWVEKQEKVK